LSAWDGLVVAMKWTLMSSASPGAIVAGSAGGLDIVQFAVSDSVSAVMTSG